MKTIICPKCGEIPYYTNFDIQKVYIAFTANGEEIDVANEPRSIRASIIPRCCYCERKIKIIESEIEKG